MEKGAEYYRAYLDGDESAFEGIVNEYRDPVTFFIQRYVHDSYAAEDIAIEVFMDLVVHRHRYNFKHSLRTYLFVLARSRALDYLRKTKRHIVISTDTPPEEQGIPEPADSFDLEEHVIRNEQYRRLHEALGQLPQEQQIAVHLVYFEQYSYEEAAKIMKKSRKQVDNLLYRAKQALRGMIGEDGVIA